MATGIKANSLKVLFQLGKAGDLIPVTVSISSVSPTNSPLLVSIKEESFVFQVIA